MKLFVLFAFTFQSIIAPIACINTTYSRKDEIEITNDLGHLIIGAFAHHGPAFYENELERCNAILKDNSADFDARNDLAAALTKLARYKEAEQEFLKNEVLHPGRYKTASNLGVLYKKMKRYKDAAEQIGNALKIKPEGHMGLGDYYLRMIQWLDHNERGNTESIVAKNFLGVRYSQGQKATAKVANKEHVITLIKNDMSFADAYVVLGDILFVEADYQLAMRAYHRAATLGDEFSTVQQVAATRVNEVIDKWKKMAKPGFVTEEHHDAIDSLDNELASAHQWLKKYQAIEIDLIGQGKDASFASLNLAATNQGLTKPLMIEQVHYRGSATTANFSPSFGTFIAVMGSFVLLIGFVIAAAVVVIRSYSLTPDPSQKPPKMVK